MINFSPGYIPSPDDPRDRTMPMLATESFEVMAKYIPNVVYDQGRYGMCVAFSLAFVMAAMEMRQRGALVELSPAWIYGNRTADDYQGEGMMPRQALKAVSKFGAVKKHQMDAAGTYPFCKALVSQRSKELDGEGLPHRIKGYVRLRSMLDVCNYISRFELPVLFGCNLKASFEQTGSDGIIPSPAGESLGGHEMVLLGVQMHDGRLQFVGQNSWSDRWGNKGRFILDPEHYTLEMWGIIPEEADDIYKRPKQIMMTIGSNKMLTDVGVITLPQAPLIVASGNAMVPLRAPFEAIGYKVKFYWMADGRHVISMIDGGELTTTDLIN